MRLKNSWCLIASAISAAVLTGLVSASPGAVPQGSAEKARAYYGEIAETLKFRDEATILESLLDDVPRYLGYAGLSGSDLEQMAPEVLMDSARLGQPCESQAPCVTAVQNTPDFQRNFAVRPLRSGDILASRFLAPKIANVSEAAQTRGLGWRKLVRLRARVGSAAAKHRISDGIILFNYFTQPGEKPFQPGAQSVNTQVMLLSTASAVRIGNDSLYWLDYGPLSTGGKLSLKLDAAFDAGDLQGAAGATKEYFVPDGCVACHGENPSRPMVNYLDTDHWFDRLDDDFGRVREEGLPVIFDGGLDPARAEFTRAFDTIRKFNEEAEAQASISQPRSFHRLANRTWLRLHENSNAHVSAINRSVGAKIRWNPKSAVDQELLTGLNRYCFRCHGTIKFNVFDKAQVFARRAVIANRLAPIPAQLKANPSFLMPPDRKLPDTERERLMRLLRTMEIK